MDTFDLHIDLGNDAMCSQEDVAEVLSRLPRTLKIGNGHGTIRDLNGNTVGYYGFDIKPEKTIVTPAEDAATS